MAIEKIKHYSMTTPATVYDEEALTALELCARTAGKLNEVVDKVNEHIDQTATADMLIRQEVTANGNAIDDTNARLDNIVNEVVPNVITDWMDKHPDALLSHPQMATPEQYGAVGDGVADDSEAVWSALNYSGCKNIFLSGKYRVTQNIYAPEGVTITGGGTITQASTDATPYYLCVFGNTTVDHIKFERVGLNVTGVNIDVRNCTVVGAKASAFVVQCINYALSKNITFTNCSAFNAGGHGFNVGSNSHVSDDGRADAEVGNIAFINCTAEMCGGTAGEWGCGFAIQATGCLVDNIDYVNCTALSPYESGFHCEYDVNRQMVTYTGCIAQSCGRRKADATYGCGFMLHTKHRFVGCVVKNSKRAVYLSNDLEGLSFTPADYVHFDILCTDTGYNVKDLLYTGGGRTDFDLHRANALIGSTFSNASSRPFYNPLYAYNADKPMGGVLSGGRITFDTTLDSVKQNTLSTPLFPVTARTQVGVSVLGYPAVWQEDPTFVKCYLTYFDANGETISSVDNQEAWTNETVNSVAIFGQYAPEGAAYACITINPAYATDSASQTYNAPVITSITASEV